MAGIIEQLHTFCSTWNLNADAQEKLLSMPREGQMTVMTDFLPPAGAAELSGKFIMFAASIMKRLGVGGAKRGAPDWSEDPSQKKGKGKGGAAMPTWQPPVWQPPVWQAPMAYEPAQDWSNQGVDPRIQEFVNMWGLNQDSIDRIHRLSPAAIEVCLNEFAPQNLPPGADVNGKFISFATKVNVGGSDKGKGKAAMGGKGKAWAPSPQASWTAATMAQVAWSEPPRKGGGKGQASPATPEAVQQFVDAWGLNEDSIAKIEKLSPEVVAKVIAEFKPRGESNDWNGKFIVFASGVERGAKR